MSKSHFDPKNEASTREIPFLISKTDLRRGRRWLLAFKTRLRQRRRIFWCRKRVSLASPVSFGSQNRPSTASKVGFASQNVLRSRRRSVSAPHMRRRRRRWLVFLSQNGPSTQLKVHSVRVSRACAVARTSIAPELSLCPGGLRNEIGSGDAVQ